MCIKTVMSGIPHQNHTVHTCAEQTYMEAYKLLKAFLFLFFSRQIVLDYNAVEFVTITEEEI